MLVTGAGKYRKVEERNNSVKFAGCISATLRSYDPPTKSFNDQKSNDYFQVSLYAQIEIVVAFLVVDTSIFLELGRAAELQPVLSKYFAFQFILYLPITIRTRDEGVRP